MLVDKVCQLDLQILARSPGLIPIMPRNSPRSLTRPQLHLSNLIVWHIVCHEIGPSSSIPAHTKSINHTSYTSTTTPPPRQGNVARLPQEGSEQGRNLRGNLPSLCLIHAVAGVIRRCAWSNISEVHGLYTAPHIERRTTREAV
jgi:hypothetical protein